MEEQVVSWLKMQRVPAAVLPVVVGIFEITDAFCAEYLDAEYAELCCALAVKLARKQLPCGSGPDSASEDRAARRVARRETDDDGQQGRVDLGLVRYRQVP